MMIIRTKYFLILIVGIAAALLAAGCASEVVEAPAVEIMMDPNTPVTEAPRNFGVGSSWVFNHTLNGETVQITGTIVDRMKHKGREVYVISDTVMRDPGYPCDGANGSLYDVENDSFVACTKDGKILSSTTPYHGRYNWPLQVGKSWRTKYFWTDKTIHPDWSGSSWEEWTVVAWEEATVPAGTFMAYKIVRTKTEWKTTSEDVAINWYAPELLATVKAVWHRGPKDGYGDAEQMWEMVSFEPK